MSDFRSALVHAESGQLSRAYALVSPHLHRDPRLTLEAAPLLVALRRTREALALLDGVGTAVAKRLAAELCFRAGLETEGILRLEGMGPLDPDRSAKIADARLRSRDFEKLVDQELLPSAALFQALAGLGRHAEARDLAKTDAERAAVGEFGPPDEGLRRGVLPAPSPDEDPRVAVARAYAAGNAAAMTKAIEEWRRLGDEAEAEILVWEAEALVVGAADFDAGVFDEGRAYGLLDAAMSKAGRVHLPALLRRLSFEMRGDLRRVAAGELRREQTTAGGALNLASEIREALEVMWGEDRFPGANLQDVVRILDESIAKLGYHRSPLATFVDGDGHRPLFATSPREDSRRQLERVRVLPAAGVREGLQALRRRWPSSVSPIVHEGELELWLGHYERAKDLFSLSLERAHGTRWAYIGLGGTLMLMGNVDEALETQDEGVRVLGSEVGSLFVYRGEARRRAGHGGAKSDLLRAQAAHPARLGAWLNLALLGHEREAQIAKLVDLTPLLVEEVLGPEAFESQSWTDADLEALLTALRGNRSSSCITFRPTMDAPLRTVPRPRLTEPHAYEERRRALLRGLSRRWARRDMSVP